MLGFKKNKKAVEMSLNLIIMLIIGLTILGLIIGLVISKKSNAEEIFQQGLDALDTHTKERLEEESGVFVLSTPKVKVRKGDRKILYAKVENDYTFPISLSPQAQKLIEEVINFDATAATASSYKIVGGSQHIEIQHPEIKLKTGEYIILPIVVVAKETTPVDSTEFVTLSTGTHKQILTVDVE